MSVVQEIDIGRLKCSKHPIAGVSPRKCRSQQQHGPARLHLSALSRQVTLESWPQYGKSEDMNQSIKLSGTKHERERIEIGRSKGYCVEAKLYTCSCLATSAEKAELEMSGADGERAGQSAASSEGSVSASSHVHSHVVLVSPRGAA